MNFRAVSLKIDAHQLLNDTTVYIYTFNILMHFYNSLYLSFIEFIQRMVTAAYHFSISYSYANSDLHPEVLTFLHPI